MNFSVSYPLRRHAFQRVGFTYSLSRSTITAFSTASQTFFQTISFRSGIQGTNALQGIVTSLATFSYSYNTVNNPLRPRTGKEISAAMQVAGIWGNVRYFSPFIAYKSYRSMHYLMPNPSDAMCWRFVRSLVTSRAMAAMLLLRRTASTAGGEAELRGFDVRSATPYGYVPTRQTVQLTNPDGSCVPRDPNNPQLNQCIQVPIPVYGVASIGGDTNFPI